VGFDDSLLFFVDFVLVAAEFDDIDYIAEVVLIVDDILVDFVMVEVVVYYMVVKDNLDYYLIESFDFDDLLNDEVILVEFFCLNAFNYIFRSILYLQFQANGKNSLFFPLNSFNVVLNLWN
jgi:hypothetical protein